MGWNGPTARPGLQALRPKQNESMKITRLLFIAAVMAVMCAPSCRRGRTGIPEDQAHAADTVYPLGFCTDSFLVTSGVLKKGQLLPSLLTSLGIDPASAHNMAVSLPDSILDVRKIRPGDPWEAYYEKDSDPAVSAPSYMVYSNSRTVQTVFRFGGEPAAWRYEKPLVRRREYADVSITSSLWNDMRSAGAPVMLISDLSDIYAWTVDFFGLQEGDRFRVIYSELLCDGEVVAVDSIYLAKFNRGSTEIPAVMLDNRDGGNLYWSDKGESLRKAFLKAPLEFKRISSGFSYHRRHPVHGNVRAHTGVDYAAPTGTPVVSIGDGAVISKGWGGGGGNTVKIRHNSVYTTAYLHLSRYADIKVGDRVRQGQVIGYVGATGTATGPHLDFRVWKNGSPINPLTMEAPPSEPLAPERMPLLDSLYRTLSAEMDSLSAAAVSASQASL